MIDAEKDFDVLKIEEFEIASLLRQITNGLKAQFAKKNIELNLDTSQKIMLNTDKYKLSQIIYNILTNAYKYTNENGEVNLSYSINNNALSIVIEDNGIGINQEDLKKIFDAYYRSNTIHNNQGEGLGLYLASENVKKIEGKIEVSSILGKGSQFSINVQLDLSNKNVVIEKKILL